MEKRVKDSKSLINSFLASLPGAIHISILNDDLTMEYISDEIELLSGYPANYSKLFYSTIVHPDDRKKRKDQIYQKLTYNSYYQLEYRIITHNGSLRWIQEQGQKTEEDDREPLSFTGIIMDITQQKKEQEDLAKEKRRLDVTLQSIGEAVISTDSKGRISLINQMAQELTGWTEEKALNQPIEKVCGLLQMDRSKPSSHPVQEVLQGQYTTKSTPKKGLLIHEEEEIFISYCATPIIEECKIQGVVLVFRDITQEMKDETQRIQLLEETKRGLNESLSLQMVTAALLEMVNLEEVLELVCRESEGLTGSVGSCVYLLEGGDWLYPVYSSGDTSPRCDLVPVKDSLTGLAVLTGEPVVSNEQTLDTRRYIPARDYEPKNLLAVPLALKSETIGALTVFNKPGGFKEEDVRIIGLFASQASVAIENAKLYKKSQELAAIKERQRLARDLHDAVSQTLFSASLIAEILPSLWEKNRQEGLLRLQELRELTRGALAEMRSLLLELRPQGLIETGMEELIKYLADAVQGRARIPVRLEYRGEQNLSPPVHVTLYRIVQESLNNIVKHARAKTIFIQMEVNEREVSLEIHDNGRGFEPERVGPDSFGLKIMEERAQEIGATFSIKTIKDQGTTIQVHYPRSKEENGNDH